MFLSANFETETFNYAKILRECGNFRHRARWLPRYQTAYLITQCSITAVASLFSVSQPARRTNVFILAKKFQSSPKPNVLDKFFYSAHSTRFRGSFEQGSSWADLMSSI